MTINCNQLDDLLLEGDPYSLEVAARHAQSCEACMEKLAGWNEISATARDLHTTWDSDLLWPRIERAIKVEQRSTRTRVWQIAAAFFLLAALGATVWIAHRRMHAAEFDEVLLKASAVDEVEQAEKAHIAAINHLETLASAKLDQASTPLMVSYKEKLMMLDDAIAECQTAIDKNRQNAYLRGQLLTMYSEKQRTLRDVLREDNHVSNR
jgi:7-cyano-7-deazaguanine synthase in queuosine biosynthesis